MLRKNVARRSRGRVLDRTRRHKDKKSWLFVGALLLLAILLATFGRKFYVSWQKSTWIPETRLTVVVAGYDPVIYSLEPESGKVLKATIPANTELETSRGMGKWFAGSLWELGRQEGKGGELLQKAVQKTFGIPVDAWVGEGGENLFEYSPLGILSSYQAAIVSGRARTNLTFYDRLSLKSASNTPGNIEEVNLESLGVIKKSKLNDGTEGFAVVPEKTRALEVFRDDKVFVEGVKLEILNTSGKSGLALHVSQIVSNLGLRVINIETSTIDVDYCTIRATDTQSRTLGARRMRQIFACAVEISSPEEQEVKLLLGKNFAKDF